MRSGRFKPSEQGTPQSKEFQKRSFASRVKRLCDWGERASENPRLKCEFLFYSIEKHEVFCYNKTNNTKGGGDMNKRIPRITSLIFQGAFSLVCILNIILCTIHRQNFDTDFGRRCADIALDLTFILFLFLLIALPTSLLLNIIARFPNDEPQKKRRLWKLWTVLSPAFYVILWFVSLGVFISSTGGV